MAYVLFTPVGGTDPIANERDGAIIHICRKYKPEHIYLYLSKEMAEHQRDDDRYRKCIRWLAEEEGFSPEIVCKESMELTEVQVYDTFFQEFYPLVTQLHDRFPHHKMIFNVSSGTPAMKSALYLLAAFLPFEVLPVQVSTPERAQNPHREPHKNYDAKDYWDCNLDREREHYRDRCEIVRYENLNAHLQRENIQALVDAYDYGAALDLARGIRSFLKEDALALLEAANDRVQLNWRGIKNDEIRKMLKLDTDGKRVDRVEYLLWLQMKQQRGDLADFLRGLTPILFELMKIAVEDKMGYPISEQFCDNAGVLDLHAMADSKWGQEVAELMELDLSMDTRLFLGSEQYSKIIEHGTENKAWKTPLLELRQIERHMRNRVAHTITRVDEMWLKREMGSLIHGRGARISLNEGPISGEIMDKIRKAVKALDDDVETANAAQRLAVQWDAYKIMNLKIQHALAKG